VWDPNGRSHRNKRPSEGQPVLRLPQLSRMSPNASSLRASSGWLTTRWSRPGQPEVSLAHTPVAGQRLISRPLGGYRRSREGPTLEHQTYWLFSASANLSPFVAFLSGLLVTHDERSAGDETLVDIHRSLQTRYYRITTALAIITGISMSELLMLLLSDFVQGKTRSPPSRRRSVAAIAGDLVRLQLSTP
jgi:hypothetical protein